MFRIVSFILEITVGPIWEATFDRLEYWAARRRALKKGGS